jgi:hypothetical protein
VLEQHHLATACKCFSATLQKGIIEKPVRTLRKSPLVVFDTYCSWITILYEKIKKIRLKNSMKIGNEFGLLRSSLDFYARISARSRKPENTVVPVITAVPPTLQLTD